MQKAPKSEVLSRLLQKKVYNLEDLNCLRISEILPEETVASCSLHSNNFTANCQVFNHCAERKTRIFSQWREETATLTTYLSDNLQIFSCLNPLDCQPIVIFNRVQDPCVPIQNNYSVDQQKRENFFNSIPGVAQQTRYNPLYSTAAKRYFATITLSPELYSFRAFLPVIDNFIISNCMWKINRELANSRINLIMATNKTTEKPPLPPKEQGIPRWKQWADRKVPPFRLKKLLPERELL